MMYGIELMLNNLKNLHKDKTLQEKGTHALNHHLNAAGLNQKEKDIITFYYVKGYNATDIENNSNYKKEEIEDINKSAVQKLSLYPPLQLFLSNVKEYIKTLPK